MDFPRSEKNFEEDLGSTWTQPENFPLGFYPPKPR